MSTIAIVGAGQAGGWAASTLRSEGFDGRIVLLGDEVHPPHERPPLSKAVLAGTAEVHTIHLSRPDAFEALRLDFRPGAAVASIDLSARTAILGDGSAVEYDRLILCTGAGARKLTLPGAESPRVHYLRTIDDALALRQRMGGSRRLIVIGGGWIGLEVAATARKAGLAVTVIEALPRLCARAVPPAVSEYLLQLHQSHGVDVRVGTGVTAIESDEEGVTVWLADGTGVRGDAVVAGIGAAPNVEVARQAGLAVDNGIVVDERGVTSDPRVFAAGDVANMPLACVGRRVRLESWANAQNQAIVAAKAALDADIRYDDIPWFWSDQHDVNLQLLGLPASWPEAVVRGDVKGGSFSLFYLDGEHLQGAVAVNAPRDLRAARRLMQLRKPVRPEDLVNPAVNLAKL